MQQSGDGDEYIDSIMFRRHHYPVRMTNVPN